jgi:hypothetical protein
MATTAAALPAPRYDVWQHLRRNPALAVWCLFVMLSPLYIAPNGLPQPGDLLVFLVVPLAIAKWDRKLDPHSARTLSALVWFTVWVFIVDYGWAIVLGRFDRLKDFLIHPFFYLFNLSIFFAGIAIARRGREAFVRTTVNIVYATIFVQVAASFFYRTSLGRGVMFFNTPNQLGYYALLAACLFAMSQRYLRTRRIVSSVAITGCLYLATLSGSRAALAGIAVLLLFMLFSNPKMILLGCLAAVGLSTLGGPIKNAIDRAEERATWWSRHGTFAEERGYDRLWKYPEYMITGAGEGGYERFVPEGEHGRELHSSFGSVVFAYGILGTILCIVFFARLIKGSTLRHALMLVPALVFAVAHQGLRFTMFWVVLSVFAVLKRDPPVRQPQQELA